MDKFISEGQVKSERFPKTDHIELGSDGWLSPRGDYYKVLPNQHDESSVFLLQNSIEVQNLVSQKYDPGYERYNFKQKKDNREKLQELGFILIRGPILNTRDALNFTPQQLEAITKSGIRIVSAYDASKEYSSSDLLQKIEKINDMLFKSEILQEVKENSERDGFLPSKRKGTMRNLADFQNDPLHTEINTEELFGVFIVRQEGGEDVLPRELFDILSSDYSDEMEIDIYRDTLYFRVVDLDKGEKLWICWDKHHHQESIPMKGDLENNISMLVVDPHSVLEVLNKYIAKADDPSKHTPKIETKNKTGYFAGIVERLITSR